MAFSAGVDRAIGGGKEEAVVLWPGICSTIVSFRYHFILGVSRFLTVCETTTSSPSFLSFFPLSSPSLAPPSLRFPQNSLHFEEGTRSIEESKEGGGRRKEVERADVFSSRGYVRAAINKRTEVVGDNT